MTARLAPRLADIQPFHVMALLERAKALEVAGRSVIHMEIGEPDFPSPPEVMEAGIRALREQRTHYSPAAGIPELRAAIAAHYPAPGPAAERVMVTPGGSGALELVFAALVAPGDEVLMADPGYPCNRHFVRLFEGRARLVPVDSNTDYQLTADLIRRHWSPATRAVLVASPSNPTGTLVPDAEMAHIVATVVDLGGALIVDEIYHGLTYGAPAVSVLAHTQDAFVVNSFSKYYGMTGWRLGWLVAPTGVVNALEKLAQNIYLAPSTPAQYAALASFTAQNRTELERRRREFQARRDYLLPALRALGFNIPVEPNGAFYLYADCAAVTDDSFNFAKDLLETQGVAVTPGADFGFHRPERHLRFSYATTLENLAEGVRRIGVYLQG